MVFASKKIIHSQRIIKEIISADLNSDGNDELIFYSAAIKRLGIYIGIPGEQN